MALSLSLLRRCAPLVCLAVVAASAEDGHGGGPLHAALQDESVPATLAALESGEIDARFPRPVGRGGNELDDCIPGFDKLKPAGQHELTFLYWPRESDQSARVWQSPEAP